MSAESRRDSSPDESSDRGQISVTLPDPMHDIVENQLKGTIGTSKSDAIRTALAIYMSERGLLTLQEALSGD